MEQFAIHEGLLTPEEAARRSGYSHVWLSRLAERGEIRSVATPFARLYVAEDVDRLAARRKHPSGGGRPLAKRVEE